MLKSETNENSKRSTLTTANAPSRYDGVRLIRMKELKLLTGLGKSTIYRLADKGRFPKPIHPFGHGRFAAWRSTEVFAWIAAAFRGEVV
jgi:prophage regulatory protein